jgi:hypothetical protein
VLSKLNPRHQLYLMPSAAVPSISSKGGRSVVTFDGLDVSGGTYRQIDCCVPYLMAGFGDSFGLAEPMERAGIGVEVSDFRRSNDSLGIKMR